MSFFGEDESAQTQEEEVRQTFGGREATLLIVECNEGMFEEFTGKDGKRSSLFSVLMRAVYEQLRGELESGGSDLFGLILYGTAQSGGDPSSFKHVYTLLSLEQANLDRLVELSQLSADTFDRTAFDDRFGGLAPAQDVQLADVFWTAQNTFANCRLNLAAKRAILATNNPEPIHAASPQAVSSAFRKALTKATDLLESGIALLPLTLARPSDDTIPAAFDLSKFFEKLSLEDSVLHSARRPCSSVPEVLALLRRKTTLRRAYCRLDIELFSGGAKALSFAAGCFAPIRPARIPQRVRVDRQTNELVQARARLYVPAAERERALASAPTGGSAAQIPRESDILLPQVDVRRAVMYADRRIVFDREELAALRNFGEPRLRLLSFVPLDSVKLRHYVRAPLFLYPDDERVRGSTALFTALLASCLERQVAAMGVLVPRRNVAPRLVALVPQRERFAEQDGLRTQLCASGFVVSFRPFLDDLRKFELNFTTDAGHSNVQERASLTQIGAARRLVDALVDDRFSVRNVRNPAIQTHYATLEAIALDLADRRPLTDLTLANQDEFERVAEELEQFEQSVFSEPTANVPARAAKQKKRPAAARNAEEDDGSKASPNKAQKLAGGEEKAVDWQSEAQRGTLAKYTIPQLKECMKAFNIRSTGTKKQELVDAIEKHFTRV